MYKKFVELNNVQLLKHEQIIITPSSFSSYSSHSKKRWLVYYTWSVAGLTINI